MKWNVIKIHYPKQSMVKKYLVRWNKLFEKKQTITEINDKTNKFMDKYPFLIDTSDYNYIYHKQREKKANNITLLVGDTKINISLGIKTIEILASKNKQSQVFSKVKGRKHENRYKLEEE